MTSLHLQNHRYNKILHDLLSSRRTNITKTLRAVFTVSLCSSALSLLWHDSKRTIHHVPKTGCRERHNEDTKKPRDTQVESHIERSSHLQCAVASPPLLTAFRYFSHLSYLKINTLSWLNCSHPWWRSVLFSQQSLFSFFCFAPSSQFIVAHAGLLCTFTWQVWFLVLCAFISS